MATQVSLPPQADLAENPLLQDSQFPAFDRIEPSHVVPGIRELLRQLGSELDRLESEAGDAGKPKTWETVVDPYERIADRLSRAWGAVSHLKGVKDSDALREAVDEVQPERVAFGLRLSQSRPLYEALKSVKEASDGERAAAAASGPLVERGELTAAGRARARARALELELRDFELSGIALDGEARERFGEIQQELSKLSTKFSNNVLDATKAYKRLVTDPKQVEGLPGVALAAAAEAARKEAAAGEGGDGEGSSAGAPAAGDAASTGPWLLTLDAPSFVAIVTHAKDREVREHAYRAYVTRASEGELDNGPLIERILALRAEKAALLGMRNYGELSLASKMATLPQAEALLEDLRLSSRPAAETDYAEALAFALERGFAPDDPSSPALAPWDVAFWAERLKEDRYSISDEELRPYFALPRVLEGLFSLAERLFGVEVGAADGVAPVWHPDVRFFRVSRDGEPVAYFYLDPYSRPENKRGGAWMDDVCGRSRLFGTEGGVRLPVAHVVCNQTPPTERGAGPEPSVGEGSAAPPSQAPSLMTFREVETLFHEFGHACQHMLTAQEEGLVAGISGVEWDAVELPSQFMENWCYDRRTLDGIARHWETGEKLPEALYQKLLASRNFRAGSASLRQLHFALLDLDLHTNYAPTAAPAADAAEAPAADAARETVLDRARLVAEKTTIIPPLPEDRFLNGFSHIFAGGYAAGYFSYKWAEVLSADAFSAFEDAGLGNEQAVQETGRRFADTVLALGGGEHPGAVFEAFRGRGPTADALLRHSGLPAIHAPSPSVAAA